MNLKVFVGAAALAPLLAWGAAEKPAWLGKIRKDHPRMFFNRDTWPQVKARAEGPAAAARAALLARCDSYPTDPVCSGTGLPPLRPGEDSYHTDIPNIREWGTQSAECALAWRLTGKREYLDKAKAMLRANVRGYQEAYDNRRAVNWFSHTRVNSLCAYDWIYEALTDDERREIIVPLVQHCENVQPRKGRPRIRRLNDGGVSAGCYGTPNLMWYAGLAALGDGYCDDLAEALIVEGQDYHRRVLEYRAASAGDDGGLNSGADNYALGHYPIGHFNIFHTWLSATGENLAAKYPSLALLPNWAWWMWVPDAANPRAPHNFGYGDDFHIDNRLTVGSLYEHLLQYTYFYKDADPAAARLSAALARLCPNHNADGSWNPSVGSPAYPFLFGPADDVVPYSPEELAYSPVKARHFETLGQIVMRSGWTTNDTYALLVGGTKTPMHKHYDEGHFTIYRNDFLALDTGTRANQRDLNLRYYYSQSVAHNVVVIQKPGENVPGYWGPSCAATNEPTNAGGMYGRTGKVLAFETNARYSYAALDTTALYGSKCTENVRQFVHVQPNVFVVYDRVGASDASYEKQFLLHTQNEPQIEGRKMAASSRGGRLFSEALLPEDATFVRVGGPGKEFWASGRNWEIEPSWRERIERRCEQSGIGPYWGAWRVETRPGASRKDDRFLHVLTAGDAATTAGVPARLLSDATRDGVALTLASGAVMEIWFNRTGAVGGEVRAGGVSRPLATSVMPQKGVLVGPKDCPPRKALVGTVCKSFSGSPEKRAALAAALVDKLAARAKAKYDGRRLDLVVLPEHALMRPGSKAEEKTLPLSFVTKALGPVAKRNGCYVAVGVFLTERAADGRDVPRNALVLLDRAGRVAGIYNKVHTACEWGDATSMDSEDGVAPGADFPVFETDFGRVGFLVCFDMSYDDGWEALRRNGAELVAVSSMSPQVMRPSYYAHRHGYWVVTSTPRSQAAVITPYGYVLKQSGDESAILSEIDFSYVTTHWSAELKGGRALKDKFGADAFGGIYKSEEDNGIWWSNRDDMTIGQMIEAVNVRPRDAEAARAERAAARHRVPGTGVYR